MFNGAGEAIKRNRKQITYNFTFKLTYVMFVAKLYI